MKALLEYVNQSAWWSVYVPTAHKYGVAIPMELWPALQNAVVGYARLQTMPAWIKDALIEAGFEDCFVKEEK